MLARATQSPMLLDPKAVEVFASSLRHIGEDPEARELMGSASSNTSIAAEDFWPGADSSEFMKRVRPYIVADGILQIPVFGVLLNRFPYQFGQWATGYAYIEKALERGMADDEVRGVAFVVDSPGGEVAGNFELVDKIYDARGAKPIRAFAADHAFSAAYSIASAADSITVSKSGGVGSIGVILTHVEFSAAMKKRGVKVTYIYQGAHKKDGNPYEQLSEQAKKRFEARIEKMYGVFVSTVARNRDIEEQAVRDTEALKYDADEGIEVGLADRVGALDEEIVIFANEMASVGDTTMATPKKDDDKNTGISQADHDAAVATATADAASAGATAERTRIKTIKDSPAASTRPAAAESAAMNTTMSAEDAIAFLETLPEEAKAPTGKSEDKSGEPKGNQNFDKAMGSGADVGAGEGAGDEDTEMSESESILADYAGQTGAKAKAKT